MAAGLRSRSGRRADAGGLSQQSGRYRPAGPSDRYLPANRGHVIRGSDMPPMPQDVQAAFDVFPPDVRHRLAEIRGMIFDLAAADPRVGAITETLKWGEPAYLTEASGSGSTIRLGWPRREPD